MTKTKLQELQTEIARLEKMDNAITERVTQELRDDDCQRPNEDCEHESLMDCNCDELGSAMEFNQSDEALIARHKTKLSSEFSKHDELQIPCSKDLDMEWANESENIQ